MDWREPNRQFVILNNIISAISRGATRNLLLSKVPPTLTEARIREDLEHIHNLHVEKMQQKGGQLFVNLNSVCVALFARTCLMSRSSYKGVKIEFAYDECSGRLPTPQRREPERNKRQEKAAPQNRFDILALTGEEEDVTEDEEEVENSSDDATEKESSTLTSTVTTSTVNGSSNGYNSTGQQNDAGKKNFIGRNHRWGDRANGH